MKYKYDVAVFDLDGTLLDTSKGIISAINYTINKNNLKKISNNKIKKFIGPPIQETFSKIYKTNTYDSQKLADTFRERYKNVDLLEAEPYAGIYDVLEELSKNIKIAVSTYKREDYAKKLLEEFGFNRYFNVITGGDNLNTLTKRDIIKISIDNLKGTDYNKIVYIGDTESDFKAAKNLGINFIGVNYGFGFKKVSDFANTPQDILLKMRYENEN